MGEQVLDLSDAAALAGSTVRMVDPREAGQADVIIITAGAKSKPNEPRTSLIDRNVGRVACQPRLHRYRLSLSCATPAL